jgi:hypothetical protein
MDTSTDGGANLCYACLNPETSREHVPPACIFARRLADGSGLQKQLITVPSCVVHNHKKGGDDEYLRLVLVSTAKDPSENSDLTQKTVRGLVRNRPLAQSVIDEIGLTLDTDGNPQVARTDFKPDGPRIERAFIAIARGLFFHEFGCRLKDDPRIISTFFQYGPSDSEGALSPPDMDGWGEAFRGLPWKGDVSDIFCYRGFGGHVSDEFEGALEMLFYKHHRVIAVAMSKTFS